MSEPIDWELIELEEGSRVAREQKRQQPDPAAALLRTPEIRNYLAAELANRHPELRVDEVYAGLDRYLGTVTE